MQSSKFIKKTSCKKCNIKVIIDLHEVPGSQNENDHSGTRDGSAEWGDSKIKETVKVIRLLNEKFIKKPSIYILRKF